MYGTKNREPLIHPPFEQNLFNHIREQLEYNYQCPVRAINGMADHIHLLFNLSQHFALKDIIKNIKGESSHWVNQENFIRSKFAWQTGYGAFSVSDIAVDKVERYIHGQKEHHRKKLYAEEVEELLLEYQRQSILETDKSVF